MTTTDWLIWLIALIWLVDIYIDIKPTLARPCFLILPVLDVQLTFVSVGTTGINKENSKTENGWCPHDAGLRSNDNCPGELYIRVIQVMWRTDDWRLTTVQFFTSRKIDWRYFSFDEWWSIKWIGRQEIITKPIKIGLIDWVIVHDLMICNVEMHLWLCSFTNRRKLCQNFLVTFIVYVFR